MHSLSLLSASFLAFAAPALAQGDLLYTVNSTDNLLRTIDPANGTTTSSIAITTAAGSVGWCNGLAYDAITGRLFAILSMTGGRRLATVDPATGAATVIGLLSDNFAGIAFRVDGTLYGVTGDGANTPESLFTIDTTTAAATLVRALGAGDDGETIGFGADLSLYHASGYGVQNVDEQFERYDTFGNVLTPLTISGHDYDEMMSLTSWAGGNLLGADFNDDFLMITTSGHCSMLGVLDHGPVKGMAVVPSPATQAFWRPFGDGCTAGSGRIAMLAGSGRPSPGQTAGLHVRLAPANAFGVLALGFGNSAVPVPSPACQVQIMPVAPSTAAFFTDAAGAFDLTLMLPASLLPSDVYWQAGILDAGTFVVTNPLQMHLL